MVVKRIFNCDKIQDTILTLDKVMNTLDHLSASSYTRVTNFQKCRLFIGPSCTFVTSTYDMSHHSWTYPKIIKNHNMTQR